MNTEQLRLLAHLVILESNGVLEKAYAPPKIVVDEAFAGPSNGVTPNRKRRARASEQLQEEEEVTTTERKRSRSSRRSIASTSVHELTPVPKKTPRRSLALTPSTSFVACRLRPEESVLENLAEADEEEEGMEEEEEDPNLGMENPTPHMLAVKRKSMAVSGVKVSPKRAAAATPKAKAKKVPTPAKKEPVKVTAPKKVATPKKIVPARPATVAFPGLAYFDVDGEQKRCEIFLAKAATSSPNAIKYKSIKEKIPEFPGANLTVVHTPAHWGPPEVFSAVKSVRALNREAGLDSFLVLVGCGISNVHMYREALSRQTKHVQLVVFEREDQDPVGEENFWRLRETTSYFLLAYFFPNSEVDGSQPPEGRMTREGATTCFKTKSIEDVENTIVHNLSEDGDWILDVACKKRELSLAALKTGRNAIALEEDLDNLMAIEEKAAIISAEHDKNFREDIDGAIVHL
jgi:hypothetical protein